MPTNPHAKVWEQFKRNTTNHVLTVLHDDGLYRHLRMGEPGTSLWSWHVVTWPGHLYVGGDIGEDYTFSRELDMLTFMDTRSYGDDYYGDGSPFLQYDYWSEKVGRSSQPSVRRYSPEAFLSRVGEALQQAAEEQGKPASWVEHRLDEARDLAPSQHDASDWLRFQSLPDWWEWDLTEWDHHYILALYAVTTTIRAYREVPVNG